MADEGSWLVTGLSDPDDVRRHYDGWVDTYDTDLASWRYDAPERAARLAVELLDERTETPDVLDAGCGTGLVGVALRAAGFTGRITGIDVSPASIAVAAGRASDGTAVYHDVREADLQRPLEFGDDTFDAAVCVGVLTYVPDTAAIWRDFARVVRSGGIVVCTQRDDVWRDRRCDLAVHRLERDGVWTVVHLSEPAAYMPGHADFGDAIGVRYLAARIR